MDRKVFLAINFLKQESWTRRAETGESFCLWNANRRLASSLVYAYKYWEIKICRLHQGIIEMPAMLIIVAQDAKFSEQLEVNRKAGKQFRPKQLYMQAVSKSAPYFKV